MSLTVKISKKIKIDKPELIKDVFEELKQDYINIHKTNNTNNKNEFSLFSNKNLDFLNKSNIDNKEMTKNIEEKNEKNNKIETKIYEHKCLLAPHTCQSLPLIIINSNKNTITSECPANGLSNILTNPHQPDETEEIGVKDYLQKISELCTPIICSKCCKKYESNKYNGRSNKIELNEEEKEEKKIKMKIIHFFYATVAINTFVINVKGIILF